MALFKSSNPAFSEKILDKSFSGSDLSQGTMSVRGTLNKFGFLLLMVVGGAAYTWHLYSEDAQSTMFTLMMVGIFGGLILALIMTFKPKLSVYLAPAYGILEGLFLGGLSAVVNDAYGTKMGHPGIVFQAVGLTIAVALAMFLLYSFRIIKATEKFKSIIISATMGIALFYGISLILRLFHVDLPFMYDSSALGIGISLFVVAIAALNLILDFDRIETGTAQGAPKFMEWYYAFGLMVTIVWLYIEILKLLMRFSKRN
ncbi:Bax inhibitor-1/YccA family protein [Chitinophagaceae bacterium LWZ2-11]